MLLPNSVLHVHHQHVLMAFPPTALAGQSLFFVDVCGVRMSICRCLRTDGALCGQPALNGNCGRHGRSAAAVTAVPATVVSSPVGASAAAIPPELSSTSGWQQQLMGLAAAPHTTARQVSDWWKSLPPQGRTRLAETHFEQLGNLDGIPLPVRDAANRQALGQWFNSDAFQKLSAEEQNAHLAMSRTEVPMSNPRSGRLLVRRSFLHTFAPGSGRIAYLLAPDSADPPSHIMVMVPGTRTQLTNFPTQYERAVSFDQTVRSQHSGFAVDGGTLMWLGYRAPRRLSNALSGRYAAQGREQLAGTVDGLLETGAEQVTVVGHSYGARVALEAVARADAKVDQVLLVAPPGEGRAGTVSRVVERTGRNVHVVMYKRDFLSRDWRGGTKPAVVAPLLRSFHGRKVDATPGVQIHTADSPTTVDGQPVDKGQVHSAYFADPAVAGVMADIIVGKHHTRILR